MIRFDERTGYLHATDLGRTASQFYINHETIEVFNEMMKPVMKEDEILDMLSRAQESYTADYRTSCTLNIGYSDTFDNLLTEQPCQSNALYHCYNIYTPAILLMH